MRRRCLLRRLFINLEPGKGPAGRLDARQTLQDGAEKPLVQENKDWISVDLEGEPGRCQQGAGTCDQGGESQQWDSQGSDAHSPKEGDVFQEAACETRRRGTGQGMGAASMGDKCTWCAGSRDTESDGGHKGTGCCGVSLIVSGESGAQTCGCSSISGVTGARLEGQDQGLYRKGDLSLERSNTGNCSTSGLPSSSLTEQLLSQPCYSCCTSSTSGSQLPNGSCCDSPRKSDGMQSKIPELFRSWPVMLRLQELASRKLCAPFRICVKGLGSPVRQRIRTAALLAGFDTVNETKEKNMWLGRGKQRDGQWLEKASIDKQGNVQPSKSLEAEAADLENMSKSEFLAMDIQIHQAIKAYLSVWMVDVSKTFGKSETCCTSLEIDCFLMERDWVYRQAVELATHCGLIAVPATNGHLKIQKGAPPSPGQKRTLTSLELVPQTQAYQSYNSLESPTEGVQRDRASLSNSLVVQRLQECFKARQKEHLFILEVSRNDIRQMLTKLAKAVGFSATKITAKGKFVATKGKSGSKNLCTDSTNLQDICMGDVQELEAHVQRGIRSCIFTWFSTFEKANYTQKSLSTSSFLMPASWVRNVVEVLAESIGAVCEMKHPGILDVCRRQYSQQDQDNGAPKPPRKAINTACEEMENGRIERFVKALDRGSTNTEISQNTGSHALDSTSCSVVPPKTTNADQVAVWNQLKFLYKQKQGAHLVWAEGLDKSIKETICEAGMKLGFTSAQDLGSYVRLSRFDSGKTWGTSNQENSGVCGCKLGKLAENLRRKVVGLDSVVIPAVTSHILRTLEDIYSSGRDSIKVEVESYPLPEFWVARIVEDAAKKLELQTKRLEGSKSVLVSRSLLQSTTTSSSVGSLESQSTSVLIVPDAVRLGPPLAVCPREHGWSLALPAQRTMQSLDEFIAGNCADTVNGLHKHDLPSIPTEALVHRPLEAPSVSVPHLVEDSIPHGPQADGSFQESYAGMSASFFPIPLPQETDISCHQPHVRDWTQAAPFCPFEKPSSGNRALPLKSPRNRGLPFTNPLESTMEPIPKNAKATLFCTPRPLLLPLDEFRASLCSPKLLETSGITLRGMDPRALHTEQWNDGETCWTPGLKSDYAKHYPQSIRTAPLATLPLRATVHYVKTRDHMDFWCNFITSSNVSVMGIDTEWKPNFEPGDNHTVALIQICFKVATIRDPKVPMYICVLFHVHHSSVTAAFVSLLENYSIVKVGVQIDVDIAKVRRDHLIEMNNCVELYSEARIRGFHARGLKGLVAAVLDSDLPKNKSITLSNWENSPLSLEQEQYAAYDAYAALRVFEALHGVEETSLP